MSIQIDQYFGYNGTQQVWYRTNIENADENYSEIREDKFMLGNPLTHYSSLTDNYDVSINTYESEDQIRQRIEFFSYNVCVESLYNFTEYSTELNIERTFKACRDYPNKIVKNKTL